MCKNSEYNDLLVLFAVRIFPTRFVGAVGALKSLPFTLANVYPSVLAQVHKFAWICLQN